MDPGVKATSLASFPHFCVGRVPTFPGTLLGTPGDQWKIRRPCRASAWFSRVAWFYRVTAPVHAELDRDFNSGTA